MLNLHNLDADTRAMMRSEVEVDIADNALYESPRLSARGKDDYSTLLLEAVDHGNDQSLANELRMHGRMNRDPPRKLAETGVAYTENAL